MSKTVELARHLETLHINNMYKNDFYWTWDKTDEEIDAVFTVADALRDLRERNKSTKVFNSGLGISIFRDNSTRTRFSFASACNLLGLEVQDARREEEPDRPRRDRPRDRQHGLLHGRRHRHPGRYVHRRGPQVSEDLHRRRSKRATATVSSSSSPTLVNLQCDVDHPTQCMADMLHIIH